MNAKIFKTIHECMYGEFDDMMLDNSNLNQVSFVIELFENEQKQFTNFNIYGAIIASACNNFTDIERIDPETVYNVIQRMPYEIHDVAYKQAIDITNYMYGVEDVIDNLACTDNEYIEIIDGALSYIGVSVLVAVKPNRKVHFK